MKLRLTKVGIIGLGSISKQIHLPVLSNMSGIKIEAATEIDSKRGEKVAKRWKIPRFYVNYNDMFEDSTLDVVFICLPNYLHYETARSALQHGLHVFCEKPMGLSSKDAIELVEISKRKGLMLGVGLYKRFEKNYEKSASLIKGLKLGKVTQVHGILVNPGPHAGWKPCSDWFLKENSGGVIFDSGSHVIDLVTYLLSDKILEISAKSKNVLDGLRIFDNLAAVFNTEKGVIGTLNIGWQLSTYYECIQIHGTGGSIFASPIEFEEMHGNFNALDKAFNHMRFAKSNIGWGVRKTFSSKRPDQAYFKEDKEFLDAVRKGEGRYVTGEEAVLVLDVLEALDESLRTEKSVKIQYHYFS